ncbi:transcriptional regulator, LysR family [Cupriavidus sp. YR651]|uniref:LysR family transcriptional regulator n=1 Tax=Cupriavidus sp. YR651 TaxID=1855315 RepID=UPI00088DF2EB|nr:LysR family transcriptional regulator [Cupriavidus sp. YR651]SDC69870.1 transcriptional regulator, LysR family [Cupriavidus sp. YR651]
MDVQDVDLNLLVVFEHLLRLRTVSGTAKALKVSQPAVSNALARLRRTFGDELFVRSAKGMLPTPFAQELAEPVAYALDALQSALNRKVSFDPLTSARSFQLAMSDIGEVHFIPKLMSVLRERAPKVSVGTVRNAAVDLAEEMSQGKIDLAVGHFPELTSEFFQRRLFRQRYVCMFRSGHALDKRTVRLKDFEQADHVVVTAAGTGHARVDEILAKRGVQRNIRLRVPHFVALADIVQSTDLVATVTEKFAQRSAASFGLKYIRHPVELPDIQINLFWHSRYHRDPASQWLRSLIFELFSE